MKVVKDKLKNIRYGYSISYNFYLTSSDVLVLFMHGYGSSKNSSTIEVLSAYVSKYASWVAFDFYAHGESAGTLSDLTYDKIVYDALTILEHFSKNHGFKRFMLFGSSMGGSVAIDVSSHYYDRYDFVSLHLKCPATYISKLPPLPRSAPSFSEEAKQYELSRNYGKIPKTFVAHGSLDEIVPLDDVKLFCSSLKDCDLFVVEGADHQFSQEPHFVAMLDYFKKSFDEVLL